MRIWLGKEQECNGNEGRIVAFVEEKNVEVDKVLYQLNLMDLLGFIDVIYFGAGEVDVESFVYTDNDIKIINEQRIKTTLELSSFSNTDFNGFPFNIVVYRFNAIELDHNDLNACKRVLKIRENTSVGLIDFDKLNYTSITKIKDGRYPNDALIYDSDWEE